MRGSGVFAALRDATGIARSRWGGSGDATGITLPHGVAGALAGRRGLCEARWKNSVIAIGEHFVDVGNDLGFALQ